MVGPVKGLQSIMGLWSRSGSWWGGSCWGVMQRSDMVCDLGFVTGSLWLLWKEVQTLWKRAFCVCKLTGLSCLVSWHHRWCKQECVLLIKMNPELSRGCGPGGSFVLWKLLEHEGLRNRTTQVVFIILPNKVTTVDYCRWIAWCMLLYVQKFIFYFLHVGLDCFGGNLGSLLGWLGLVYFPSFLSLLPLSNSLPLSDDLGWGLP